MVDEPAPEPSLAEAWRSEGGRRWASVADRLEAQLEPLTKMLFDTAALRPGERVLDVGCGRGTTTRAAAQAVMPGGAVTGLDIAFDLIDDARRVPARGAPIEWIVANAQGHPLPDAGYDVVISRLGVMFFDDAPAAFTNLRRATRPAGRLAIAVWQTRDRSEILQHTLDVARDAAHEHGYLIAPDPPDSGPFAFGRSDYVNEVLHVAGWRDVRIQHREVEMYAFGPGPLEDIVEAGFTIGPVRAAVLEAPVDVVDAVRSAIRRDLAPRHDGTGVKLKGAFNIVTATCE